MKFHHTLSHLSLLLGFFVSHNVVQAFAPATTITTNFKTTSSSSPSSSSSITTSSSTKLNALSAEDILKRARKAAGVEEEPEPEPIFNDGILNDFQESLLLFEKRVKQGPGSLSYSELIQLNGSLNNIIKDMNEYRPVAEPVSVPAVPTMQSSRTLKFDNTDPNTSK